MELQIQQTAHFERWLLNLRDLRARIAIARRIDRASQGNLGDARALGDGLSELRVDLGLGYRIYYMRRESEIILLMLGGDKSTQRQDIQTARTLMQEYRS